ncbi:hypothetical protein SAMN00017405_0866 [Desulfonispora thiosulfatigenes DSM 11270]|uniref:Ribosomal processing cysteine protease Prp n=1 Tax=Desulfonispora thiosulfatigenes DSM 11270 TaxID=656914 RepID=A0A1W1UH08_DESTI|nr:ribosomal-processing cysteine protease Prp [Desulfonispora thiosulfatigenes]SMB80376.1 hypothetical protein SAMN00017405_0866 [Desulfonispora thiosulfatigenes DSM 11270]
MISADLYLSANEEIIGFEFSGHAFFADSGKDIVCAAASVLATTTVNSLELQLDLHNHYTVDEKSGYLKCMLPKDLSQDKFEKAQIILKTLEIGIKSIELNFSQYIKLSHRRWN